METAEEEPGEERRRGWVAAEQCAEEARGPACEDRGEEAAAEERGGAAEERDPEDEDLQRLSRRPRARRVLAGGAVRLLSAAWLLARGEAYILERMQDLQRRCDGDERAFLEPGRAAELLDQRFGIVAISYGWLSKRHPDPTGFHMRTVQRYLKSHLLWVKGEHLDDVGVFWDFASLPQDAPDGIEKTAEERRAFKRGLHAIGLLYGDPRTLVIQLTKVPEAPQSTDGSGANLAPYEMRGWCFFEATVSGLEKESSMLLDLGLGTAELELERANWNAVREASTSKRRPPLRPEDMAEELQKRTFTNSSDADVVAEKYASFFREVAAAAQTLDFTNYNRGQGWGDTEVMQLSRALPSFTACKKLCLCYHKKLGEKGLEQLHSSIMQMPSLEKLELPIHLAKTKEGKALISDWQAAGKQVGWLHVGH